MSLAPLALSTARHLVTLSGRFLFVATMFLIAHLVCSLETGTWRPCNFKAHSLPLALPFFMRLNSRGVLFFFPLYFPVIPSAVGFTPLPPSFCHRRLLVCTCVQAFFGSGPVARLLPFLPPIFRFVTMSNSPFFSVTLRDARGPEHRFRHLLPPPPVCLSFGSRSGLFFSCSPARQPRRL